MTAAIILMKLLAWKKQEKNEEGRWNKIQRYILRRGAKLQMTNKMYKMYKMYMGCGIMIKVEK